MYSLRRVLAVRFSLTLFIALGLIALWAMVGLRRTLSGQIDSGLAGAAIVQRQQLRAGSHLPRMAERVDFVPYFESGARAMILRDSTGRQLEANATNLGGFPHDTAAFRKAVAGHSVYARGTWFNHVVRSLYTPGPDSGPFRGTVIQLAASLRPLASANQNLLLALLGTVILGTVAIGIGAFWLAGSAVAPVREVAAQAQALTPETLHDRITAHTDVVEYQSLIRVLNDLLERGERAFIAQRRLIADLGHELRTPLTALRGEIEVTLRSARSADQYQRVMHSALEEIDRLNRIGDALLLITRVESGASALRLAPTDINELVQHSLYGVEKELATLGVTVSSRLNYAGRPPLLDSSLTARMLDELVENAVQFSPAGQPISVGTEASDAGVRFWIQDSGPGVRPEHLAHLFDAFFRADEARTRSEQTGLGLTVAASIARAHGGTIQASNTPGSGARFTVELPLEPASANGRGTATA